jgi:hypothetical protein
VQEEYIREEDNEASVKRILIFTAVFLIWAVVGLCAEGKKVLTKEEIAELAKEVEAAEKKLVNIKVESEVWLDIKGSLDDPYEKWQRTPVHVHSTAWYDGRDGRKVRIDVHKEMIEWQNGPVAYAEEKYSASFDGESGRYVHHTTSYEGGRIDNNKCVLSAGVPKVLKTSWCQAFTGARFSFHFFFRARDGFKSFSQVLKSFATEAATGEKHEVSREVFEGRECIKIFVGQEKQGRRVFRLDAARGYGLFTYELINVQKDGRERIVGRLKVRKMKKVGEGIWWPQEAEVESEPNKEGMACQRLVYQAKDILCNDPNFDSGIFTVDIPTGYTVEDKALGVKYKYLGQ